jgi:hypothetical protein
MFTVCQKSQTEGVIPPHQTGIEVYFNQHEESNRGLKKIIKSLTQCALPSDWISNHLRTLRNHPKYNQEINLLDGPINAPDPIALHDARFPIA